jgi:hypothetical protein
MRCGSPEDVCIHVLDVFVRIRIIATPKERELDGVPLDVFRPGKVCDVSSTVAAWLVANGYALPEMRRASTPTDSSQSRLDERRRRHPR